MEQSVRCVCDSVFDCVSVELNDVQLNCTQTIYAKRIQQSRQTLKQRCFLRIRSDRCLRMVTDGHDNSWIAQKRSRPQENADICDHKGYCRELGMTTRDAYEIGQDGGRPLDS